MADGNNTGTSNGTTDVTLIAAPAASTTRMIPARGISIFNGDTVSATVTVQLKASGGDRVIETFTIATGDTWYNSGYQSLANTTDSLEFYLSGAVTTNELTFTAKYRDEAQ